MVDADRLRALRLMEKADQDEEIYNDAYLETLYGPILDSLLDNPTLLRRLIKEKNFHG